MEELYAALNQAEENDQLATARCLYERLLAADEKNGALWTLYAENLIELGDLVGAERALGQAEQYMEDELKPGFLVQQGHLSRERGDLQQAEENYRRAYKLNPADGEPLVLAAAVAAARGEIGRAEYLAREAAKLTESEAEGQFQLGSLLVAQKRYVEAHEAFSRVLEAAPENHLAEEWLEDLDQVLEMGDD